MHSNTCDGCGHHFLSGDEVAGQFARHYAEYMTEWYLCIDCVVEMHRTLQRINRRKDRVRNG